MSSSAPELPTENRALLLTSFSSPATLTTLPAIPSVPPNTGTVLLRVLATPIAPYASAIHAGHLSPHLPGPLPLIPNANGIARVVSSPPDALYLKAGQLVYVDCDIRARDDPASAPLFIAGHYAGHPDTADFLARSPWKNSGTLQEHVVLPLENVYPLDEARLVGELGYTPALLSSLTFYTVAAGAVIEACQVRTGETVVIGPAGGSFGGAAVELALAMGAGRVIILGRDEAKLSAMKRRLGQKVEYVVMSGDSDVDSQNIRAKTPKGQGADVYNDWTPGILEQPPYLDAGLKSLVKGGRIVLSGSPSGNAAIPYSTVAMKDLKITGKNMFTKEAGNYVIKLLEQGILDIGKRGGDNEAEVRTFKLEEVQDALKDAEAGGWRRYTVVTPYVE